MKRILIATLLCLSCHVAYAVDTDGDGLLDLIDTAGFDPEATGVIDYCCRHIQDLDGANLLVGATTISLSGNQIANIENGDFEELVDLEQLGLASNRIASIESGDFTGLDHLQRLYLFSNRITSVESGDFDGLEHLQQLYLFDNQITSIESGDFQELAGLQELYLYDNRIASIEDGDFQNLQELRRLDLSGNELTHFDSQGFQGLDNLQWLALFSNQISSIENGDFQGLSELRQLFLFDNQITSIESGDFQELGGLRELYLYKNQIADIQDNAFEGLENLERLNISDNELAGLESGAFRAMNRLRDLSLSDNELTELNFADADFESLASCLFESGLCIDRSDVVSLILDDAELSQSSFAVIVGETTSIRDVSLVGLRFTDGLPADLSKLLSIHSLDNVAVDADLFNLYANELTAFDALPGNTVTVLPLPGDTNGDRVVDLTDLNNVRSHFGQTGEGVLGDTNHDQRVDLVDLNNVRNFFGVSAPQSVPEPGGCALLVAVAGASLLARRGTRRRLRCGARRINFAKLVEG